MKILFFIFLNSYSSILLVNNNMVFQYKPLDYIKSYFFILANLYIPYSKKNIELIKENLNLGKIQQLQNFLYEFYKNQKISTKYSFSLKKMEDIRRIFDAFQDFNEVNQATFQELFNNKNLFLETLKKSVGFSRFNTSINKITSYKDYKLFLNKYFLYGKKLQKQLFYNLQKTILNISIDEFIPRKDLLNISQKWDLNFDDHIKFNNINKSSKNTSFLFPISEVDSKYEIDEKHIKTNNILTKEL